MRKLLAAVGLAVALLGTAACSPPPAKVGVIEDKYIEDFTEFEVVLKEDGTGTLYHFAVSEDQWRDLNKGDRFSTSQLDQPADD